MEFDINNLQNELSNVALSNLTQYATTFCKNLLVAIIVYLVGRFIIKRLCLIFAKILAKKETEKSLESFLNSLISITMNFLLIIIVVGILGIETSSFMALFASAGVAIGLALSGTLQNFAGGVMILFFKPYKVGDVIEAQGYCGGVTQIQIFNTILCTPDNQTVVIPNGPLATGCLKNYSTQPIRRIDIPVEVAYGSQSEEVRSILLNLANNHQNILQPVVKEKEETDVIPESTESKSKKEKILEKIKKHKDSEKDSKPVLTAEEPVVFMTSMGASSLVFELRFWVESANYFTVKFDMTEQIYNELKARQIEIPFQQLDVHLKN